MAYFVDRDWGSLLRSSPVNVSRTMPEGLEDLRDVLKSVFRGYERLGESLTSQMYDPRWSWQQQAKFFGGNILQALLSVEG